MNYALKFSAAVVAVMVSQSAGFAADMPPVYVPAPPLYDPPPVQEFSGWYLRGDIGMSNQRVEKLYNMLYDDPNIVLTNISKGFDSGAIYGFGIGYRLKHWARVDFTGEYRGKTNFRGMDTYVYQGNTFPDDYSGSKSEWLLLANFYADLGTWWCLTPFVGLGLGASRNTIHDFRDVNLRDGSVAYGRDASKWNFAWAVHAGVGYEVAPNLTLELSYRFVWLGDAASGDLIGYDGRNNFNNPMEFHNITSHDVRLGMRWNFGCCDVPPPPPPLMRRG